MGNSPEITDILFDLGRVLAPLDWGIAFQRLSAFLPPHRLRLLRENRKAFHDLFHDPVLALEKGELDFDGFHSIMCETLDVSLPMERFHLIWCDIFRVNSRMVALGRALSERYGTWLVSNTSEAHYRWIVTRFPEILFYRGAALSYELGVMKPAAAYYEKAVCLFRVSARNCVFIDDLAENVEGAVRAGMTGIVFTDTDQLTGKLRDLGIAVDGSKE